MSTEHLQLPGFILAGLYKNDLVIVPDDVAPQPAITQTPAPAVAAPVEQPVSSPVAGRKWFLGDNKKQVTILVKDSEAVFLRDEWLQFLSAILGACKLNIGDVAIVNYTNDALSFSTLQAELQPKYMLLFDITPQEIQLPIPLNHYQLQPYNNCQLLASPSLQVMQGDGPTVKLEKSKLWLSLKQLFGI